MGKALEIIILYFIYIYLIPFYIFPVLESILLGQALEIITLYFIYIYLIIIFTYFVFESWMEALWSLSTFGVVHAIIKAQKLPCALCVGSAH